ncbi:MAG: hypothetical protein K2O69_00410 [Odoribacter sp.]|nr:hypothetical protein [Odoribacter sp.]
MLKDLFVPKGDVKVVAKIANASIAGNETNGYTVLETNTDASGRYEFEIPVLENGLQIELEALPFEGSKSTFDSLYRKEPKFSDKMGVFEYGEESVTLYPYDIKHQDIKYEFTQKENTKLEEDAKNDFKKTSLYINVKEGEYNGNTPFFTSSYSPLEVKITDGNNIDKSLRTEDGMAVFEILHTTKNDIELTVTVTSSSYQSFLEVPYYEEGIIQGAYKQFCCTDEDWNSRNIATVWNDGFRESQKITISFNNFYKSVNVFMIFKPDQINTDFNSVYGVKYYEEWLRAYFRNQY